MAHHSFRRRVVEADALQKCRDLLHNTSAEEIHAMVINGKLLITKRLWEKLCAGDVVACQHLDKHVSPLGREGMAVWIDELGILPIRREKLNRRDRRRERWREIQFRRFRGSHPSQAVGAKAGGILGR